VVFRFPPLATIDATILPSKHAFLGQQVDVRIPVFSRITRVDYSERTHTLRIHRSPTLLDMYFHSKRCTFHDHFVSLDKILQCKQPHPQK
jgi:hypothetical protein